VPARVPAPAPAPVPERASPSSQPPRLDAAEQSRLLDIRVEKMFQAEGWFRRGEKSLGRGKHGDALAAFEHAVELCPDEGEFLAWLGYARYAAFGDEPREISRSLDELARGCTLAPKLDVAHLLLARVLRATGDISKARDAYERALAANPDCREAYDAIRELAAP
jgi:tetratricopeptide (TPR) repeat protein